MMAAAVAAAAALAGASCAPSLTASIHFWPARLAAAPSSHSGCGIAARLTTIPPAIIASERIAFATMTAAMISPLDLRAKVSPTVRAEANGPQMDWPARRGSRSLPRLYLRAPQPPPDDHKIAAKRPRGHVNNNTNSSTGRLATGRAWPTRVPAMQRNTSVALLIVRRGRRAGTQPDLTPVNQLLREPVKRATYRGRRRRRATRSIKSEPAPIWVKPTKRVLGASASRAMAFSQSANARATSCCCQAFAIFGRRPPAVRARAARPNGRNAKVFTGSVMRAPPTLAILNLTGSCTRPCGHARPDGLWLRPAGT
jgi:hypothetical protein